MKTFMRLIALCLCAVMGAWAFSLLPWDRATLVQEKYEGWSGVLRVWVCEDMRIGGASPMNWLSLCAASFEKGHKGIYVNVQSMPASVIADIAGSGLKSPDMIIWPAGLIESADGLLELSGEYPLRQGLDISPYAVPLLTDARMWIYDSTSLPALPGDMYTIAAACRREDLCAMVALSTGKRSGDNAQALPGVDLGLPGNPRVTQMPSGDIECRASAELMICDDARARFLAGDVSAFVGNLRDLALLADKSGWSACVTGEYAWVEEMALCSIIDADCDSATQRQALCQELLSLMLSEGQLSAARAGAMPAAAGITAYSGDPVMAGIEAALEGVICACPRVFGKPDAPLETQLYIEGKISADQAMAALIRSAARFSQ